MCVLLCPLVHKPLGMIPGSSFPSAPPPSLLQDPLMLDVAGLVPRLLSEFVTGKLRGVKLDVHSAGTSDLRSLCACM